MIYLASPYWHDDSDVRRERFNAACQAAGSFLIDKVLAFSPVAHCYPIDQQMPGKFRNDDWIAITLGYLARCQSMVVLELPGWNRSKGVAGEMDFCKRNRIPIIHASPDMLCERTTLQILQRHEALDMAEAVA